jgi:NTE family protein
MRYKVHEKLGIETPLRPVEETAMPSIAEVLASSLNIMQVRIARSRLAGEPPDVTIAPRLAHLRLLDFHRAQEAIEEGRRAVERVAHAIPLNTHSITARGDKSCADLENAS